VNAEQWNERYPVGSPVLAYPGIRPDAPVAIAFRERAAAGRLFKGADKDPCTRLLTRTRTVAQKSSSGHDVVWVDGHGAYIALTHIDPFRATDTSPEASAARNVPVNPRPLCRSFQSQPEPAEFWCATCHWNKPMHDDDTRRAAIAEALNCLPVTEETSR
jgi:hypothetical protein